MSTKRYRVQGVDTYTINFQPQANGTYKISCTEHPANPFSSSVHKCHLYGSGDICVAAGKEPRTLDHAVAIAHVWMDGYSNYVRTGTFPTGGKKVEV